MYEILCLVASQHLLVLTRFWCPSIEKCRSCSKFSISLTQRYRTKLRAIAPKTNNFMTIILQFKTFIYNRNSKIIYYFYLYEDSTPPVGGGEVISLRGNFLNIVTFRTNASKYAKLMVELHVCDNYANFIAFFQF